MLLEDEHNGESEGPCLKKCWHCDEIEVVWSGAEPDCKLCGQNTWINMTEAEKCHEAEQGDQP